MNKLNPVLFTQVTIEDKFWAPILDTNRRESIPAQYQQCLETGRIDAFKLDWKPGMEPVPHVFWDSDVAKWVEAASYSLATHPDAELERLLDSVIELIVSAQQPDGYLNVHFTVVEPDKRWTDLRDAHELYCAGHLMEAGVAHYHATGKRILLDAVCRYADYIGQVFGRGPGQKRGYCGHEEIELALVKLYRATGEERYLRLSEYFVNERGQEPYYFELEEQERGDNGHFGSFMHSLKNMREYNQSHKPVRELSEVTGHAVRAMYLYSAMADLAGELGDESLLKACERLWTHLCTKNMYITGGIGSTRSNEGFTFDYDLPNETAYAETCAAVGLVFWNHRLLQLDCDGRYADVMERALYNGTISGMSLDGKRFFYDNPLASLGDHHRRDWFGCSCCPPNLARLLASLGEYVYSQNETDAVVHLYVQGSGRLQLNGQEVRISQKTEYPWDGKVILSFDMESSSSFALKLRIPGWCKGATLSVNGETVDLAGKIEKGYIRLSREWSSGDIVELNLPMPVERMYSHPLVRQNAGCVALQRGPVVYCLEEADHLIPLQKIAISKKAPLSARYYEDVLGGVVVIKGQGVAKKEADWKEDLYRAEEPKTEAVIVKAVPYYAWDNRKPGQMRVWINEI